MVRAPGVFISQVRGDDGKLAGFTIYEANEKDLSTIMKETTFNRGEHPTGPGDDGEMGPDGVKHYWSPAAHGYVW